MNRLILILGLLLAHSAIAAEADPPTVTRFQMGKTSLGEARKLKSLQCSHVDKPFAEDTCELRPGQRETIAGISVRELSLNFFSDKLHQMIVVVPAAQHAKVTAELRRKWGTPAKSETGAMGIESVSWRTTATALSVTLLPAIGRTNIQFQTDQWSTEHARRMQAEEGVGATKNEPLAAELKRRCESARQEDEKTCAQDLGNAIEASRPLIARDDNDPEHEGAKCEPLLYGKIERSKLVESTRKTFVGVLNTSGTEHLAQLPMTTMVHRALRVVCITSQSRAGTP